MITAQQMIEALALNGSPIVKAKCSAIVREETTIEAELKYCGSFLTFVLKGEYYNALDWADHQNKQVLEGLKNIE